MCKGSENSKHLKTIFSSYAFPVHSQGRQTDALMLSPQQTILLKGPFLPVKEQA